jgi:hypothetical protein
MNSRSTEQRIQLLCAPCEAASGNATARHSSVPCTAETGTDVRGYRNRQLVRLCQCSTPGHGHPCISGAQFHNCQDDPAPPPRGPQCRPHLSPGRGAARAATGRQDHAGPGGGQTAALTLPRSGIRQRPREARRAGTLSRPTRRKARHPRRDPAHASRLPSFRGLIDKGGRGGRGGRGRCISSLIGVDRPARAVQRVARAAHPLSGARPGRRGRGRSQALRRALAARRFP